MDDVFRIEDVNSHCHSRPNALGEIDGRELIQRHLFQMEECEAQLSVEERQRCRILPHLRRRL